MARPTGNQRAFTFIRMEIERLETEPHNEDLIAGLRLCLRLLVREDRGANADDEYAPGRVYSAG